jgi:glycosyltransferase involved in cell wall biosynthesis
VRESVTVPLTNQGTAPVSVVVLTYLEELNLETCLRSVAGWSKDIHVLDSGSTDRTLEIATRLAHQVHHHPYVDHASQIAHAIYTLPLQFDWVLLLDADREVSDELKLNISTVVSEPEQLVDGFYIAHRNVFRGHSVRGLNRWRLIFVRHSRVEVDDSELIDCRLRTEGSTGFLKGEIIEHNLKENDLDFWIDKQQRYTTRLAAEEALRRAGHAGWSARPRLLGNPDERLIFFKRIWYRLPLFVRPFLYFGYRYIWKLGFLDGPDGFLFHFL